MTYRTHTLRRILTCAAAAALLCTSLAGCSGDSSSSSESGINVNMEDLEYGATMRDDTSRAVPLNTTSAFWRTANWMLWRTTTALSRTKM